MLTPPTKQWELRADARLVLEEYFEEMGWDEMLKVVRHETEFRDDGVNKAIVEYNESMDKALKQLGRLATRLGYIKGE